MQKIFDLNSEAVQAIHEKYIKSLQERTAQDSNMSQALFKTDSVESREIHESLSTLKSESLRKVIESIFSASLEMEEGRFHDFSVKLFPDSTYIENSNELIQDILRNLYIFKEQIPLSKLSKLAPALQNSKQEIYAWCLDGEEPFIWAFGKERLDSRSLKIIVSKIGQLIIELPFQLWHIHSATNYSVLINFSKIEFIDKNSNLKKIFTEKYYNEFRKLCSENPHEFADDKNKVYLKMLYFPAILGKIIFKMKQHTHGGTLLIIENESNLSNSIQENILFAPNLKYELIKKRIFCKENHQAKNVSEFYIDDSLEEDISLIGQLTAIDGATIITGDFEVIAFGAKIKPIKPKTKPKQLLVVEPFENSKEKSLELSRLGGTRHQSAAQFVFDQKEDAFAIVASQDGKISVMFWDESIEKVRVIQHAEYLFV